MRVLLTPAQVERILARTVESSLHKHFCWWLETEHTRIGKKVSVLMPPDAWLVARDILVDFTIRDDGRRRQVATRTSAWHTLTRVIVHAVNVRQAHPGPRGQFALNVHEEIIPVWGTRPFASLASSEDKFQILVPYQRKVAGNLIVTGWAPGKPTYDLALEEEAHHLLFGSPRDAAPRRPHRGA